MALIGLAGLPAAAQSGRTFYIDYASGSNNNNGTSKSSSWKVHPYMQTSSACTGTESAPAYTHQAGDQFIFKGGVTWPAACFGMNVTAGGTSGTPDYYGVDLSWFSGASFARPVFDLNNTAPIAAGNGGRNVIFVGSGASYTTWDNIEIKRQFIVGGHSGPNSGYDCGIYFGGSSGHIVENGYFHDWVTDTANLNAGFSNCAGGLGQNGGGYTADNMTIEDDGGLPVPFGGCFQNPVEVKNSICHHVAQGSVGFGSVHDSQFYGLTNACCVAPYTNGIHTNVIHDTWSGGGRSVYNNVVYGNSLGEVIGMCPTTNVYNNVMWSNSGAGADILVDTGVNACTVNTNTVANIYNNTVDCSNGVSCLRVIRAGQTIGTLNFENNHWITSNAPVSIELTVVATNQANNILMSPSTAASQGYTTVNWYAPSSSSGGTVGRALILANFCSGGLGALCSDRVHAPRLTSWDAGAYEFGSTSSKPNPPGNLNAIVQ
jgi:hypothetical protein